MTLHNNCYTVVLCCNVIYCNAIRTYCMTYFRASISTIASRV